MDAGRMRPPPRFAAAVRRPEAGADGERPAVISLRRNLGLPRTPTAVDRLRRTACRGAWSEATGRRP